MVKIKFFAMLKGIAGVDTINYDVSGPVTVGKLKSMVVADIPALAEVLTSRSILVSVNQELVKENDSVTDGDEVAFLPPYSGG